MFGRFFKSKKPAPPKNKDWEGKLIWLPAGHVDNPFSIEVLDCRVAALGFLSATENPGVIDSFSRLRASDGTECRRQMPEGPVTYECDLSFPFTNEIREGPLYRSPAMEYKWDFDAYDGYLYVRRSWTGRVTYVAELEYLPDRFCIRRFHCEAIAVYDDRAFAIAQLNFLVTAHVLGKPAPYPIELDFPRTAPDTIATMGFFAYGRQAQYAAYVIRDSPPAVRNTE